VLAECVFILTKFYKAPREEAAARLGELLDYKGFTGARLPNLKEALAVYAAGKIGFVDRRFSPSRATMAGAWRPEIVEAVPGVVHAIDARVVGPQQIAAKLEIIRRAGEDQLDPRTRPASGEARRCNRLQ
jgi:hypothetical protein